MTPPTSMLFLGNLPFTVTKKDVLALVRDVTHLEPIAVSLPVGFKTVRNLGFAFAAFKSPSEAGVALKRLAGAQLGGRPLRCELSRGDRRPPHPPSWVLDEGPPPYGDQARAVRRNSTPEMRVTSDDFQRETSHGAGLFRRIESSAAPPPR